MTDGSNGDLVRELRSAAEWHRIEHDGNLDDSTAPQRAASALEAQSKEIEALRSALEPFAEAGQAMLLTGGREPKISGPRLAEHLERARTALKGA